MIYKPLEISNYRVVGVDWAMMAMRLPKGSKGDTPLGGDRIGKLDLELASAIVKAGDDHAKCIRGINVYLKMRMQTGFMIEFETYRHGVECLSTSSTMHNELKGLKGPELAEKKQKGLPEKVYTRVVMISYQTLRRMYHARHKHRHPDWQIFCNWIEILPYFEELIKI